MHPWVCIIRFQEETLRKTVVSFRGAKSESELGRGSSSGTGIHTEVISLQQAGCALCRWGVVGDVDSRRKVMPCPLTRRVPDRGSSAVLDQ